MFSIKVTILLLQITATMLMGVAYYSKDITLKICNRYYLRKIKEDKKLLENRVLKKKNLFFPKLLLVFIFLVGAIIYFSFSLSNINNYMRQSDLFHFVFFILIAIVFSLILWIFMTLIEEKIEIISNEFIILSYKLIINSSKKGFVVGVGFLLIMLSIFLQLIEELNIDNQDFLDLLNNFSLLLLSFSILIFNLMYTIQLRQKNKNKLNGIS